VLEETAQLGEKETKKVGEKIGDNRSHPGKFKRPVNPVGVLPSAPPLFGTDSFLPLEERRKLQMAFPVFDRGKGHACYSTLLKGLECLGL
ncbi:hypothetical protein ACQP3C_24845, partial [Escherichia coli]